MSRFPAYPRSTALRSGSEGRRLFGERKESSPQLRLGSCSASLLILQSKTGLTTPGSANPSSRFQYCFLWCRFRFRFLYCKITAALIRESGRPSENVRGSNTNALDPPSLSRAYIPAVEKEETAGMLPKIFIVFSFKNISRQVFIIASFTVSKINDIIFKSLGWSQRFCSFTNHKQVK